MTLEERQALRDRIQALAPVRDSIRQTNRAVMAGFHEMLTAEQERELRAVMRRSLRGPRGGPGMRARRGGGPGAADAIVGAAFRSGFQAGMMRGRASCRLERRGPGG
jgi:hypothetical protein